MTRIKDIKKVCPVCGDFYINKRKRVCDTCNCDLILCSGDYSQECNSMFFRLELNLVKPKIHYGGGP